jgi:hypothetical protein
MSSLTPSRSEGNIRIISATVLDAHSTTVLTLDDIVVDFVGQWERYPAVKILAIPFEAVLLGVAGG